MKPQPILSISSISILLLYTSDRKQKWDWEQTALSLISAFSIQLHKFLTTAVFYSVSQVIDCYKCYITTCLAWTSDIHELRKDGQSPQQTTVSKKLKISTVSMRHEVAFDSEHLIALEKVNELFSYVFVIALLV